MIRDNFSSKTVNELGPDSVITILSSNGCDCYHWVNQEIKICDKIKVNGEWDGDCEICDNYSRLWHLGQEDQARKLKPLERYYYKCLVDGEKIELVFGLTLSRIIGNKVGKFKIIKKLKGNFPDYSESHFIGQRKKYRAIDDPYEVSNI